MRRPIITIALTLVMIGMGILPALAHDTQLQQSTSIEQSTAHQPVFIESHRVDVEIENQIARTRIEQVFVNEGSTMAEGTYVFPLPRGVTISDLVMYIDGIPIQSEILEKDEARQIYDEIVRSLRDPALLEYIGNDAIQASVFPIPAGEERKLEIEYTQLLTVENGIINYVYPVRTRHISPLPVGSLSIRVSVNSNDDISNIYSPTHPIAVDKQSDTEFVAGFETNNTREANDFSLYYGLASDEVNLNLLTYRESANEDGFFTLLVSPPAEVDENRIIPKDVIIVLDQSGSMFGDKWDQARDAAKFVLDHLNAEDRFNVVVFSTGVNVFATDMQAPSEVADAKDWLDGLEALGGTNIDSALQTALDMTDADRQGVILFLTDGLATEGNTETSEILGNVSNNTSANTRIFTFGVGDDVDTFLLDQLSETYRGAAGYVRPQEDIEAEVSLLYNKISAPVLTNLEVNFGDLQVYDVYPNLDSIPDLFIGSQLVIVGRYRESANNVNLTLSGDVQDERQVFTYPELRFRENAGGEALIPRLWATRKIGELLNSIRLNGENPELVDSIVRLSIRYGIITPYTSFLITEDDILSQTGRDRAFEEAEDAAFDLDDEASGASAVDASEQARDLASADNAPAPTAGFDSNFAGETADGFDGDSVGGGQAGQNINEPIRIVTDRTFIWRNGVWMDTTYNPDEMTPEQIEFLSDEYFDLLDADERVALFYALGDQVIFVLDGQAYEVVLEITE